MEIHWPVGVKPLLLAEESIFPQVKFVSQRQADSMIVLLPTWSMRCWRTTEDRLATSAKKATTAQASSHHIRAIDHLYQSLNKVESIAKQWRDAATAMIGSETALDYDKRGKKRDSPIVVQYVAFIVYGEWYECGRFAASSVPFVLISSLHAAAQAARVPQTGPQEAQRMLSTPTLETRSSGSPI